MARARYQTQFESQVFVPSQQTNTHFVPAGKRRDQTTSEMFGSSQPKELQGMPKTFVPKDDDRSARQKKVQECFHRNDVLPPSSDNLGYLSARDERRNSLALHSSFADLDERTDPNMRRQHDLSSKLFGRGTPAAEQQHDRSQKLTPNDCKWFNAPERALRPQEPAREGPAAFSTHSVRAYHEKCSNMFNRVSPDSNEYMNHDELQQRDEEAAGEMKRRNNQQYSDLFGRDTPMELPDQTRPACRQHRQQPEEDSMGYGRAMLSPSLPPRTITSPRNRKSDELHKFRIFHQSSGYEPPAMQGIEPVSTDNSRKTVGLHPQRMHQAHLKSSVHYCDTKDAVDTDDFYKDAENAKHWEVVELHISGLGMRNDEHHIRALCQGTDLHIIKVTVETDPVRNHSTGRAKVMVRYNPKRDSIMSLVRKLEQAKLRVEI